MNTLSYRCTKDHGLSVELLVDGQPLTEVIGSSDRAIPYWMFEDDLPYLTTRSKKHNPIRVVAVCACGESGCSSTQCQVSWEKGAVVFHDFSLGASSEAGKKEFKFTTANYNEVISGILKKIAEYKGRT